MTRVVWVGANLAAPPRTGATLRSHRLLEALARDHEVHVVVVGQHLDAGLLESGTGAASVSVFPERQEGLTARVLAVRRGWPVRAARPWSRPAAVRVAELARGAVVVLDHVDVLPYRPSAGPWVLATHNAEAHLLAGRPVPGGWRRLEHRRELRLLGRLETAAASDPRCTVVAVSAHDARLLGAERAVVVPNGADLPVDPPAPPTGGSVLMVGSLDYAPNAEGVAWWSEHVRPHLPTGAELVVVEREPGAVAGLPGVRAVGEVDDVGPWLAQAAVVAVPLLSGGGTRLKVLEGLAWGRPVVSTTKGAEGLGLRDGEHLLLRDEPRAFAEALVRAREDRALAARLGVAGRRAVEELAWPRAAQPLLDLVDRLDP